MKRRNYGTTSGTVCRHCQAIPQFFLNVHSQQPGDGPLMTILFLYIVYIFLLLCKFCAKCYNHRVAQNCSHKKSYFRATLNHFHLVFLPITQ